VSRWRHVGGEFRWLEGNLLALIGPDGRVWGYRGTHRDITERKHQQERILRLTRMLQMQSGINAAVVRIRERDALLREACRLALQVGGYDHVMVSLVEPDGGRAVPWYRLGMSQAAETRTEGYPISDGTESDTSLIGRALRTGEITISTDLTKTEPPVACREQLLAEAVAAFGAGERYWVSEDEEARGFELDRVPNCDCASEDRRPDYEIRILKTPTDGVLKAASD